MSQWKLARASSRTEQLRWHCWIKVTMMTWSGLHIGTQANEAYHHFEDQLFPEEKNGWPYFRKGEGAKLELVQRSWALRSLATHQRCTWCCFHPWFQGGALGEIWTRGCRLCFRIGDRTPRPKLFSKPAGLGHPKWPLCLLDFHCPWSQVPQKNVLG